MCGLLMFPNFKGDDWYVFVFTTSEFTGELIDSPEGKLEWISDEKLTVITSYSIHYTKLYDLVSARLQDRRLDTYSPSKA